MGQRITLKAWSGSKDEGAVTWQLAKVFRLEPEEASAIVHQLTEGKPWKFAKQITGQQARIAKKHLATFGFAVELGSDNAPSARPASPDIAEDLAAEDEVSMETAGTALGFHGDGMELFKIVFVNQILTVITFGIYYFWAKTKTRAYVIGATAFGKDRFSYHGTGKELFKGGMVLVLIVAVLALGSSAMSMLLGPGAGEIFQGIIVPIAILLVFPALMVGAFRYRLSRTAWRSIRFSFRGVRMDALKIYIKGVILTVITLGFYFPLFAVDLQKFWRGRSWFGNLPCKFSGEGREIYSKFIVGILLTIITLGIYGFWLRAFLQRYYWSKTALGDGVFHFDATGGELFKLNLVNMLIMVFTLGLGFSWVIVRNMKFVADHLSLQGDIDVNKVLQEMKASGALGEEALDAFDVPLDVI